MRALLIALLLASQAIAQEVKLPAEIHGSTGAWIVVAPEVVSGGSPKWRIDQGLTEVRLDLLFPPEVADQARGKVFTSNVDGRYRVEVWNAKGDVASDITTCWVVVGKPVPSPVPTPQVPPVNPPGPVSPLPLAGMRVLTIWETDQALPTGYMNAMRSQELMAYLSAKCLKGPDGRTPERREFDEDSSLSQLPPPWQVLRAALPTQCPTGTGGFQTPHVAIGGPDGSVVFSGPYPPTEQEALELFRKYGG